MENLWENFDVKQSQARNDLLFHEIVPFRRFSYDNNWMCFEIQSGQRLGKYQRKKSGKSPIHGSPVTKNLRKMLEKCKYSSTESANASEKSSIDVRPTHSCCIYRIQKVCISSIAFTCMQPACVFQTDFRVIINAETETRPINTH